MTTTAKHRMWRWILPSVSTLLAAFLVLLPALAIVSAIAGTQNNSRAGDTELPALVEGYRDIMVEVCTGYGMLEFVDILLAIMAYESGGAGLDPMNASEFSFNTEYPQAPGGIQDPRYSIEVAVQQFKYLAGEAGLESPADVDWLKTVVQAYNFGAAYIGWAFAHADGCYTQENALEYSGIRANELGVASYGNPYYVTFVMQYYALSGGGTGTGVFVWPLPGFTTVTCEFGGPDAFGNPHRGMDISSGGQVGPPIVACDSGTVIRAEPHDSWGNYVKIDHGNGYTTLYAHCSGLAVSVGQTVGQGETIAYVGSTGVSTGPHLHLEVELNGTLMNARELL